ncbi:DUF4365 domain-containing protein [Microvirga sp. VF16]|uniref:DUF4365 domain-containing protein n=1 Tax=Microvirga sp. VF16 TaxID=2807101 RepID=UPI00193E878E|nr:DUF4365 domain-containing protein [Microvirga sp. VF16]QRM36041.1 DUF4365 domain-containing protein [Microvirga sp. VF16]
MDLPARTVQKKSESDSYAILLYKLRELGVFRNMTESDYGIDFEIELVINNIMSGRYFKAQVKSADGITIRKDDVPTVGGVKQSTLAYWCELSQLSHVLAFAVDLSSEEIYVSLPLFWQSSTLIDGTSRSKTIEFVPSKHIPAGRLVDITRQLAMAPSARDEMQAFQYAVKYFRNFIQMRYDVHQYDAGGIMPEPVTFDTFLRVSSVLTFPHVQIPGYAPGYFNTNYWSKKGGSLEDGVMNIHARSAIGAILPELIKRLRIFKMRILDGWYYWESRNRSLLALAYDTPLPADESEATLDAWEEQYDKVARRPSLGLSMYIQKKKEEQEEEKRQRVERARDRKSRSA